MYCALDLKLGEHARARGDLFVPDGAEERALVAILPGGPWDGLYRQELRPFALALAEQGVPCAPMGFRPLADGARGGEALLAELTAAIQALLEESAVAGMDGRSLVLLGSGWGSLPALLLASRLGADARLRVRGAIACGATPSVEAGDIAAGVRATAAAFHGGKPAAHSPIALSPASLPPLLILHGDADEAVHPAVAERFVRRQADSGEAATLTRIAGAGHQFLDPAEGAHARAAVGHIVAFLATLGGATSAAGASEDCRASDEAREPTR